MNNIWITSGNKVTTVGSTLGQVCNCTVKKLSYDAGSTEYIIDPTVQDMVTFLGVAENGVAIAENLAGQTQFYAVLAKDGSVPNGAFAIYYI